MAAWWTIFASFKSKLPRPASAVASQTSTTMSTTAGTSPASQTKTTTENSVITSSKRLGDTSQETTPKHATYAFVIDPNYDLERAKKRLDLFVSAYSFSEDPRSAHQEGNQPVAEAVRIGDNCQFVKVKLLPDPKVIEKIKEAVPGVLYVEKMGVMYLFRESPNNVASLHAPSKSSSIDTISDDANVADAHVASHPLDYHWHIARIITPGKIIQSTLQNNPFPIGAGTGVTAYVIDDGVDFRHPEFEHVKNTREIKIGRCDNELRAYRHGTAVASLICGKHLGLARGINLVSVRCPLYGAYPHTFSINDLVEALRKVEEDIEEKRLWSKVIINLSWGGAPSDLIEQAIKDMQAKGAIFVVAAGNSAAKMVDACDSSPGRLDSVVTVGAIDINNNEADYSQSGRCVNVYAPGKGIWVARYNTSYVKGNNSIQYSKDGGTSYAASVVTGLLALEIGQSKAPLDMAKYLKSNFKSGQVTLYNGRTLSAFYDVRKMLR